MVLVVRPMIQWHWRRLPHSTISHPVSVQSHLTRAAPNVSFFAFFSNPWRQVHFRSRALRLRNVYSLSDSNESDDGSSNGTGLKKSRNESKREARRAVRWGVELASFSPSQIHRILRVADLEQEVFDAIMLVKKLDRDVREGKRRQFNYIGRLLRGVEPELMDDLIQATKDGHQSKFQNITSAEILVTDDEEEEEEEIAEGDKEEESVNIDVMTRWYDGLINKDISIMNDIYSLRDVEFDRQELRQLVRKVHSTLERKDSLEETRKPAAAAVNARRSLTCFLQGLVKQLPAE